MTSFRLPDLGEGLQEAEIVSWHVSVGDHVVNDQPLLSVETEKAVVEIPSPQSGQIAKLYGGPGDMLRIGARLVDFEVEEQADKGAVVGELPKEVIEKKPSLKALPAVRELAKRLDVDLFSITPTGSGGAITRADVEAAAGIAAITTPSEHLRGVRRAMARNMSRAGGEAVPATLIDEAIIGHWPDSADPTIRLIHALVAACQAEPSLNAWYDGRSETRQLHKHIDLGIAMDTDDGLFVPVMRDAANRDDADLRAGLDQMKQDVRSRTVPPEELRGQTITLSNFGMIGGRHTAMAILPPQVAILGAGRLDERPIAVNGEIIIGRVMPLSLTFDHRAVTGGEAGRFLNTVISELAGNE